MDPSLIFRWRPQSEARFSDAQTEVTLRHANGRSVHLRPRCSPALLAGCPLLADGTGPRHRARAAGQRRFERLHGFE
jgi:hypothetical protein